MNDTFVCAACGKTFEKVTADEEADKEAKKMFGVDNASKRGDFAVICDPCYTRLIMPTFN